MAKPRQSDCVVAEAGCGIDHTCGALSNGAMQRLPSGARTAVRPPGEINPADPLLALGAGPEFKPFVGGDQMKTLRSSFLGFDQGEAEILGPITRALLSGLGVVRAHQECDFFAEPRGRETVFVQRIGFPGSEGVELFGIGLPSELSGSQREARDACA